jgi:hypothetical protein
VLAIGGLLAVLLLSGVVSQASELESALKNAAAKLQSALQDAGVSSDQAQQATDGTSKNLSGAFHALLNGIRIGVSVLGSLAIFLSFTALSLFFLLKDGPQIRGWADSGAGDNAYQGARLSLRFNWLTQTEAAPAPTTVAPIDPPAAAPTAPATTDPPAGAPAADPNGTVTADQLVSLPSTKSCLSRRKLIVRVHAPRGVNVKTVGVTINGNKIRRVKGSRAINLRGLPRGTVRVSVRVTLSTGRKLTLKRTYRTCAKR